jgi:hypothetical protein
MWGQISITTMQQQMAQAAAQVAATAAAASVTLHYIPSVQSLAL